MAGAATGGREHLLAALEVDDRKAPVPEPDTPSAKLPDPLPVSRKKHGMPDDGDGPESIALVARDQCVGKQISKSFDARYESSQPVGEDLGELGHGLRIVRIAGISETSFRLSQLAPKSLNMAAM